MPLISSTKILARYTRLFVAFFISGLIHHASDLAMGIPASEAGALRFFLLQPIGIMLEDAAQSTIGIGVRPYLRRLFGYVWVLSFLVWTTPTWFYPPQRMGLDAASLLPFHVVAPALAYLRGG